MKKTYIKKKKVFYRDTEHDYKLLETMAEEQRKTVSELVRSYVHAGIKKDSWKRKIHEGKGI